MKLMKYRNLIAIFVLLFMLIFIIGVGKVVSDPIPANAYKNTARLLFEPSHNPVPYETFDPSEFTSYADPTIAPTPEPTAKPKPKPASKPKPVVRVAYRAPNAPSVKAAQKYALSRVGRAQYNCLYLLWKRESGWRTYAHNRSSGAYGIPQALPGNKMASAGSDWRTNPITQVKWGLRYIKGRYGSSCNAWRAFLNKGWY